MLPCNIVAHWLGPYTKWSLIFYHFSTLMTAQLAEILPDWKWDQFMPHSQYHDCWWPGDVRSQSISNHGIDQIIPENSTFITERVKSPAQYILMHDSWCFAYLYRCIPHSIHIVLIKLAWPFILSYCIINKPQGTLFDGRRPVLYCMALISPTQTSIRRRLCEGESSYKECCQVPTRNCRSMINIVNIMVADALGPVSI